MPLPATHVLINLFLFYPFRKSLGKYWLFFAILSGLFLDFDFAFRYIGHNIGLNLGIFDHGLIVHTFGFILLLFGISLIVYSRNKEYGKYGFIITIGSAVHLLLDYIIGGGAYYLLLFYPFSMHEFHLHLFESYDTNLYGVLDAFLICIVSVYYLIKMLWYK
jgi:hypothetical protein